MGPWVMNVCGWIRSMDMLENYQRGWGIGKLGHVYTKAIN